MIPRLIVLFLVFLACPVTLLADAGDICPENKVTEIEAYLGSFSDMSADFIQIDRRGRKSKGKFFLKRAELIKLVYESPRIPGKTRFEVLYDGSIDLGSRSNIVYNDVELGQVKRAHVPDFFLESILTGRLSSDKLRCTNFSEDQSFIFVDLEPRKTSISGNAVELRFRKHPNLELDSILSRVNGKDTEIKFLSVSHRILSRSDFELADTSR